MNRCSSRKPSSKHWMRRRSPDTTPRRGTPLPEADRLASALLAAALQISVATAWACEIGMTAGGCDHLRGRACGPLALHRRRNHLILSRDQVPAGLAPPRWRADHAGQRGHSPGHLRCRHEAGLIPGHIGREGGRNVATLVTQRQANTFPPRPIGKTVMHEHDRCRPNTCNIAPGAWRPMRGIKSDDTDASCRP